ncbi:MAG: glucodextranase DOMON-like domain-containing protein [Solirubrobacteraceae bacterium]
MRRGLISVLAAASAAVAVAAPAAGASVAPGAPGTTSYFDLARKDCVGTARNDVSKVWFTVADGVLSDTYWPNVDATNVKTLQYIVTDGRTFSDLQTRDMTYQSFPDSTGMGCTVVASSSAHRYRIVTTYVADPARDAVLMRTQFLGPSSDRLYVRLDALAGGTGGGGDTNGGANSAQLDSFHGDLMPVAFKADPATDAVNRTYAVPTYEALESSGGFSTASVGYAGSSSDGQQMLDSAHALTRYESAPNGHVALTAAVRLDRDHSADLALGFATTEKQALRVASDAADQSFFKAWSRYERQWDRYDAHLRRPSVRLGFAAARQYYRSVNVVKASEDKTFHGAIAAGLASPWGQAVAANTIVNGKPHYFGSYREVFARDLYQAFTGLLVAGDLRTARAATRFLFEDQQQADGSVPRNSLENGKVAPDTGGVQLDETSYPILMDWQSGLAGNRGLYRNHVIPAADFLVAHGPTDGVERWEEQNGYSPSTIAAEIAGLTAAAHIASVNGDSLHAAVYQATADDFARNIKAWTVTTTGPFTPSPYFLRLSKTGDPNAAITYNLGNGVQPDVDQRQVIDAGFLELVRLGVLPANDTDIKNSVSVVDKLIERSTNNGPGFYRYGTNPNESADGYGDCFQPSLSSCNIQGEPWPTTSHGTGHLWPVLSGERGEYDIANADRTDASALLTAIAKMTSGDYLEPEQVWENAALPASPFGSDPTTASIGFTNGQPVGSASPLTWAQATYARLAIDLGAGRNVETPAIVTDRYVTNGPPGQLPVTITTPSGGTRIDTSTVQMTGTTAPGAKVVAEASGVLGGAAGIASTTADSAGNWSLTLPVGFGSSTITVTATRGGSTGYAQVSVSSSAVPGKTVFSTTDPAGDDNGPGTYAYPTSSNFTAGSFDLTGMQVNQTDSEVFITLSFRTLVPTFGNPFGAQMLDVYVHQPGATTTSTAAAFPQRNYTIAPADAWSERVEVQGFASPVWIDPSGNGVGSAVFVPDDGTKTATIELPIAQFGTVGSGWTFTVALTGQDGFSSDQARGFAPTPQDFLFGVCQPGGSSPICALDQETVSKVVPKVMDTFTPTGVDQSTELDPTRGPVVLTGVTVP